jgi:hypothetical protein
MTKQRSVAYATAGLAAAAILGISARAEAADCSTYPNPVFISGSSASQPVLQALALVLGSSVSIIYQNPDSCFGLNDAITGTASTESGVATSFLDPVGGTAVACTLNTTTPEVPDIGVSDVFIETCQNRLSTATVPTGQHIAKVNGPIQAMTIAVPTMSQGSPSISAEAAYVVFGGDGTPSVAPWTMAGSIYVRPNTSGTLNMIGEAIGLPATKWANAQLGTPAPAQQQAGTGNMFSALAISGSTQDNTIGILSDEAVIQRNHGVAAGGNTVKVLPFQGKGQSCGYFPDSTSTRFDKLNVRQGRYAIWGPLHFVVNVDANGYPSVPHKDAAATVLNYFIATSNGIDIHDGAQTTPFAVADAGTITDSQNLMLIDAESAPLKGGVVPWCAMEVQRTSEIGAEASFQAPQPCGCRFEATATGATVSPYCKTCASNDDCKNPDGGASSYPVCRWISGGTGFCEAR